VNISEFVHADFFTEAALGFYPCAFTKFEAPIIIGIQSQRVSGNKKDVKGIVQICFDCSQFVFIGSNVETFGFGQEGHQPN
jgi:hypothetical protein